MIEFKSYYSSSTGNLYSVSDGKTTLMLDCGVPWKKIQKAFDFKTSRIAACLLDHEHADHSKAALEVMKAGIDVYALASTFAALGLSGHRAKEIQPLKQFKAGSWTIIPFEAVHDVPCVGFLLASGKERALFCVDSNYIKPRFRNLSLVAIGVNYDTAILNRNILNGTIGVDLGKRIMRNHLSLSTCLSFLKANDMSRVQGVWLLHLSDSNSDEARFKAEVEKVTGSPTYIGGKS